VNQVGKGTALSWRERRPTDSGTAALTVGAHCERAESRLACPAAGVMKGRSYGQIPSTLVIWKTHIRKAWGLIWLALMFLLMPFPATAEEFTNAIRAFLQQHYEGEKRSGGMVIGIVDEQGSRVVSYGTLDNGTGWEMNGDTLFELGSITKTFTALLLQQMIERGEMMLDDPVAEYLPTSVVVPAFEGKQITLRHLATHTSGLPFFPTNLHPKRVENPYVDYTAEQMLAFLSGYQLKQAPGTKWDYSELGMQLLGYAIARKAGTNYEALLVERICRPLQMDSTRTTMSAALERRLAQGHNALGYPVPALECGSLVGGGALHSSANDLLKYVSANLGLAPSSLTPLLEKTHRPRFHIGGWYYIGLAWLTERDALGTKLVCHAGATFGHSAFIGLDKARRRGVVVLSSSDAVRDTRNIGQLLLESEWRSGQRPQVKEGARREHDAYTGEYQLVPTFGLGILTLRLLLLNVPAPAFWIAGGACVGILLLVLLLRRVGWVRRLWARYVLRWRPANASVRRRILVGLALLGAIAVAAAPYNAGLLAYAVCRPVMGLRSEGGRLFLQFVRLEHMPSKLLPDLHLERLRLPFVATELLPESESRYIERMSGIPMEFWKDKQGKVTHLRMCAAGNRFAYEKISNHAPEAFRQPVPVKLDPKLYDACAGTYEFDPDELFPDGIRLTLRRQGDQLIGEASDKNGSLGALDIFAESETNLYASIGVHLAFDKNSNGEVTRVIRRVQGWPDSTGKKLTDLRK
jgi:serine-type D-Ala-D-Ala carboxypeptidase/endopeptidase